ncbi:hypothetical protein B0H21DRAFT_887504, partial [Amylocystis lapponica]
MQETGPALPDSRPSLSLTELHQTLSVPSSQDAGDPFAREDQSESAYIPHSSDAAHLYLGSPQLVTPLQLFVIMLRHAGKCNALTAIFGYLPGCSEPTVRLGRQGASMLLSEDRMRGVSAPVDSDVHHDTNEPDIDELSSDFSKALAIIFLGRGLEPKPDSLPFDIEVHDRGKTVVAFAKSCTGQTISGIQPCENCSTVTQRVDDAITIAGSTKGTNRAYLSPAQLRHSLENTAAQLNQHSIWRALGVAARKLSDCRRFAMAIAEMDVPRVQVIVQTALRKGSSLSRIVNKIERHSKVSINLGAVHIGLPSLRTLRKYSAFTKIMPTVGMIKCTEIVHNIREVVLKGREALHGSVPRRVEQFIWEKRCQWWPYRFWREGLLSYLGGADVQQETAADMEMLFTSVIRSWNEVGAGTVGRFGQLRQMGTPLDVRQAIICLSNPSQPDIKLIRHIVKYGRLNLYTGDGEITLDFDWKHIFNDSAHASISYRIVLNSGIIINPTFLARYLVRLEDQTPESVQSLLYPMIHRMSHARTSHCLSKFSHLSCAFFRGFRVAFMSNQLYGDSQTMVKNVMFSIAKQQQLDGSASFFVGGVGDDELEKLFGRLRMLGGHDSGMNYRQGIDRLGHAKDIDSVLLRQPDLDPGHRRLNLARTEEVDHITEDTWRGDVVAGKVDLPSAWESGAAAAAMTIQDSQMLPTSADFANIFADPTVDLLRPFGRDKYPGIEMDEDRSMVTESTTEPTLPAEEPTCAPEDEQLEAEEDETPLTLEEGLEEVPELSLPSGPGVDRNDYIEYKGRWIHKQSLCRLIINKAFVAKSHNRPERVRGFTKSNKLADTNNEDVTGPDAFIEGDMFLTLARTKQTMSLALVRSTRILEGTIARKSILIPTLSNPKANTKLEGQVMILRSTLTASGSPDDPPTTHSDTITQDSGMLASWAWNGGFIMLGAAMRGTDVVTEKACKVSIPGHLARPLNMDMVSAKGRIKDWDSQKINSVGSTWEMASVVLEALSDELWTTIIEGKIPLGTLPSIPQSTDFPYLLDDGITPGLLCEAGSRQLEAEAEST